jgi:opacity protein-like surface antigen
MLRTRNAASVLALALFALWALPAAAQSQGDQRGYITGFGGAGSTTEVTAPFFGGSVGVNVTPNLQITGDFGRMQDVLAHFTREDLSLADKSLTSDTNLTSKSTVKMPTNFVSGGIRLRAANNWAVQPYVLAHAGIAHMSPKPTFTLQGLDITSTVMADPYTSGVFREETRPMATFGGGVTAVLMRHVQVDVGYKYSGIFIKSDFAQDYQTSPHKHDRIDTHRVYGGIGLVF